MTQHQVVMRAVQDGLFIDYDNDLTLSIQWGTLSYASRETKRDEWTGVDCIHVKTADIAVKNRSTNELIPIHKYEADNAAVPYVPISMLPTIMSCVQENDMESLRQHMSKFMDDCMGSNNGYGFTKGDAEDAISRG